MSLKQKKQNRDRRHARVRSQISGTPKRPRLAVFRSNTSISAQIIDDEVGKTLASAHSRESKAKTFSEKVREVGALVSKRAQDKNIKEVVFDRGGFLYTGHVKTLADAARDRGLKI